MSEKKEKKKPKLVLKNLSGIQLALIEASRAHRAIIESSAMQRAIVESARISKIIHQSTIGLQTIMKTQTQLHKMLTEQARILEACQVPQALKAMAQYEANVRRLAKQFSRVQQMVRIPLPITSLETRIRTIPSRADRAINSLLNYIAFLEGELSKEKTKNKELLRILEELRKDVKRRYVV